MPDDVKSVAGAVLQHHLVVDLDRSLQGLTARGVIEQILGEVPAPPFADA